jgi:hypothetical protein
MRKSGFDKECESPVTKCRGNAFLVSARLVKLFTLVGIVYSEVFLDTGMYTDTTVHGDTETGVSLGDVSFE